MTDIYAVRITHGDHHAVEHGELIGPLTAEQAREVEDTYEPSQVIWKAPTAFEAWQRARAAWNEGDDLDD